MWCYCCCSVDKEIPYSEVHRVRLKRNRYTTKNHQITYDVKLDLKDRLTITLLTAQYLGYALKLAKLVGMYYGGFFLILTPSKAAKSGCQIESNEILL